MSSIRAVSLLAATAALGVLWLASPFLDAVALAAVVAVLAWPMHTRIRARLPRGATAVTLLVLTVGVTVPFLGVTWLVAGELMALIGDVARSGAVDALIRTLDDAPFVRWYTGGGPAFGDRGSELVRDTVATAALGATSRLSAIVGGTVAAVLDVVVFHIAVATFLHHGERFLGWTVRVTPFEAPHLLRLFDVFARFARNVVAAGLVGGTLQGVAAAIGYWLAGVDRPLILGALTAVVAFVPLVGSSLVYLPVSLSLLATGRDGAALFTLAWSLLLTGTVDNLVKPFVIREGSDVPLLLVVVGMLGGFTALGAVGLLLGPVLVAVLLALLHIHEEQVAR